MDIHALLQLTIEHQASDLHLCSGQPPVLRVDGDLQRLPFPALDDRQTGELIECLMNARQRQYFTQALELDFAIDHGADARFRVNAFQQQHGPAAVLRRIPSSVPTLETLGLSQVFRNIAALPNGLVLVTGPTGSGKSTTLAALIGHINRTRPVHILTLEDPIEFIHSSQQALVNQRELGRHTHDFDSALRSALREDPDIILLGELRDLSSIRLALTAAETGHLVFATLHTSSAAKTIDRIVDVFPGEEKAMIRSMLAESLQAVIAQRLLKKRGGGRLAAHEVMLTTAAIRNLIREGRNAQIPSAIQTGAALGMQTLESALNALQHEGLLADDEKTVGTSMLKQDRNTERTGLDRT